MKRQSTAAAAAPARAIRVRALVSFVANLPGGGKIRAVEGKELDMPAGQTWIRDGLAVLVRVGGG